MRMETRSLGREHWLRAARLALRTGGPPAVNVEALARSLAVTKGSFYWHFADRDELMELLIAEWEHETADTIRQAATMKSPREAVAMLFDYTRRAAPASDEGHVPSDAAMFLWAQSDPAVAVRVEATEKRRLKFLVAQTGRPEAVELVYLAWVGFVSRRMRNPRAVEGVDMLAALALDLLFPTSRRSKRSRTRRWTTSVSSR